MDTSTRSSDVISQQIKQFGFSRVAKIQNSNVTCPDVIPSTSEYLTAISWYGIALVTFGVVAVLIILYIFNDTVRHIIKNSPPGTKSHSTFIIGVYPVIALATLCATIVPRSQLLAEAVTQGTFMVSMYQFFCLIIAYCGGEAEVLRKVKPASLLMKVEPCCCWPCCCCLPSLDVTKDRVRYLRLLVLQLPIVQGLVYMTLLVLWAERESLYQINYVYVQPVIVTSILIGVWGMSMSIRLLKDVLKDYKIFSKFVAMKLVLILSKLQNVVMRIVVSSNTLPCYPPLNPMMYANMIYNSLMLFEMVLLAFLARKLYKFPLPTDERTLTVPPVCTLEPPISTIDGTMPESSNNGRYFTNHSRVCPVENTIDIESSSSDTRITEKF